MSTAGNEQPEIQLEGSPAEEKDARLAAAVLRKDRKATAEFVARFADGIYAYVRSRLLPRHDLVDDLVQEVFLAAWENLQQYRGTSPLQAWLMGIARHKVEDVYRRLLRAPHAAVFADVPGLEGLVHPSYPPFDLGVPDQQRADIWLEEFRQFEGDGRLPRLSIIRRNFGLNS